MQICRETIIFDNAPQVKTDVYPFNPRKHEVLESMKARRFGIGSSKSAMIWQAYNFQLVCALFNEAEVSKLSPLEKSPCFS
jgi:hypothetical protein